MGALRDLIKAIDLLADSLFGLTTELALLRKDMAEGRPFHFDAKKFTVDGSDPKVQEALGIKPQTAPEKTRKRYRGTYTDEQSISKRIGRKVTRGELKDAARAVGVAFIQDETNHHVYIMNSLLDIVIKQLKRTR